jgi:hypothetical protein
VEGEENDMKERDKEKLEERVGNGGKAGKAYGDHLIFSLQ